MTNNDDFAGGGGGAGFIRINTNSGAATVSGPLSPGREHDLREPGQGRRGCNLLLNPASPQQRPHLVHVGTRPRPPRARAG